MPRRPTKGLGKGERLDNRSGGFDRTALPPKDFVLLAGNWCRNRSAILLGYVWQAYDTLKANPPAIDTEDLERSLTQVLVPRIRAAMTGYESFGVEHGPYERETKKPPPAQPPQYDIAFVLYDDERVMWPLEAKLLTSDRAVTAYASEIRAQFLTCRYSPFSSEGAMLGYLLAGDSDQTFRNIAARVPCLMIRPSTFKEQAYRVSCHKRKVPAGKPCPPRFLCHHLLMPFPEFAAQRLLPL